MSEQAQKILNNIVTNNKVGSAKSVGDTIREKLNDALEARRIKEAEMKQAEYEKLSRNQAYEQLERNRQEKYQYFLGTKFDRYI